jgi:molecular chaperone GrpE
MSDEIEQQDTDEVTPDESTTELESLKAQAEELEHKYKLALADYQNLLRQTTKERRDAILYANEALILDLLPVYDNLKLSIKHSGGEGNESWLTGLQHVIQQFKKVLEEAGVKEIKTEGEKFDPITMEAVENRDTVEKKLDHTVAEELKAGYMLHDKVIAPARVAVFIINKGF